VALPFNLPDGVIAGELIAEISASPEIGASRAVVRVDLMLLAQAKRAGIRVILSEEALRATSQEEHAGLLGCPAVRGV
jgi:hypothetical protein